MPDLINFHKNWANDAKNAPRISRPKPSLDEDGSEVAGEAEKVPKNGQKVPKRGILEAKYYTKVT